MLKTLKIENFRRFRQLSFNDLKRANLIAGKNNTGKTGVLEALLILLDGARVAELPKTFRNCDGIGDMRENFWKWLFYNHQTEPIVIRARSQGPQEAEEFAVALGFGGLPNGFQERVSVESLKLGVSFPGKHNLAQWQYPPPGLGVVSLAARPSDPQKDARDYDRVVLKSGGEERLERLLQTIEPALKSIRSIKPHGAALIYADVGMDEKIPAIHLGQGFMRLLSIYSELIASDKRILLIDEIENGLHHSVLIDVWRGLLALSERENVQVFATTHSYECILAAHQAFAETLAYDFALHRLDVVDHEIKVTTYDKEALETSFASHWEVR